MSLLLLLGDTDSNPRSLFASGEQGGYYDPSVANTLFQLSDGVTAATQPGDPVGLIIDSRKGGLSNLGSDLVTNGTFSVDSDWTKGANWTIGSGVATKTGGAANNLTQTIASTAGAWYRLTMDVTRTAGTLTVSLGTSGTTYAISATGTYTFLILAGSSTQTLTLAGDSSFAGTVDNVVARNVPGNHLYQTVSGSRGTLSREPDGGKRNLLTYTEQFDNAAWTKPNATVTANATTSFNGELVADEINEGTSTNFHQVQQSYTFTTGQNVTLTCDFKYIDRQFVNLAIWSNSGAGLYGSVCFDIQNGAVQTTGSAGAGYAVVSSSITSLGNGWYRCQATITPGTTAANTVGFTPTDDGTISSFGLKSYAGTSKRFYVTRIQLETGSTATAYQRNTTQYDCTESGKRDCWAVDFDGSDDSYLTSSVDFSGTDKMTVWAGVWKRSDAARGTVVELTATAASNNGAFHLTAPNAASATIVFESKGTSLTDASASVTAPATRILCGIGDIAGDTATLRVDGVQADSDTGDQGTGNYANAALYVGRRGNSTLPFSGRLYGLIIRGVQTTTSKVREFEKYVARITGRQI